MHHHANRRFDWSISGHQSLNPSKKEISILSGKYKRFTFVHPGGCQLFNLIGTTAVCESWNVSDKYNWDNAGDHKQLSMDQTLSKDNRSN